MNECIDCDRACYYTRCSQCQDAYDRDMEREAKQASRAEEYDND